MKGPRITEIRHLTEAQQLAAYWCAGVSILVIGLALFLILRDASK